MTTVTARHSYLDAPYGLAAWLLTKDHKRIAMLYLISITIFFAIGGLFAAGHPARAADAEGRPARADIYNKLFTMHGVVMIFFFLIPSIPATLGNFLIPIMCGTKDLAFPRINLLSWYLYVIGGTHHARRRGSAAALDTGWTFYTPYSTIALEDQRHARGARRVRRRLLVDPDRLQLHRHRAPHARARPDVVPAAALRVGAVRDEPRDDSRHAGHRDHASCWSWPSASLHLGIFDPKLGGDPVLFQHLFWFYSHPAVYIMILPGMGVISELVAAVSRKQIFGYAFVAFSSLAIAILGFLVWGHHLFVSSQSIYAGLVFSIITMLVAVPSAVKTFNWAATMYKGSITWESPTYWVIGFMGLFLIGGLTGLFLASMGLDIHLTDTYFVVAHFHYIMVGGAIMAFLGGLHFWWPKMTGRMYREALAQDRRRSSSSSAST